MITSCYLLSDKRFDAGFNLRRATARVQSVASLLKRHDSNELTWSRSDRAKALSLSVSLQVKELYDVLTLKFIDITQLVQATLYTTTNDDIVVHHFLETQTI